MGAIKIGAAVLVSLLLLTGPAWAETPVGLAWVGKSGMAQRVTAGLEKGLAEFGQDIKLESKPELASLDDLAKLIGQWAETKKGQVILRSNGAKWLGANPPAIPSFIGGCNHPSQLGAVKNLDAPEGNITGVTYYLPVDNQFETFKAILPEMKTVLLLCEKGHPSSQIDIKGTKDVCAGLGLELSITEIASKEEAVAAAQAGAGKVSAIVLGNQAKLIDNAKDIVAGAGKTPVFSYSSIPVKEGALGGFVADDQKLGYLLAQSVVQVLLKGKAVKDVPVKVDPQPKFFINAKAVERLGVEVPYNIIEAATVIE